MPYNTSNQTLYNKNLKNKEQLLKHITQN